LFADDSLLFFKADTEQAGKMKNVLCNYELATGQLLSPEKCSILLGNKCSDVMGQQVMTILNVQTESFEEKYLGLPVPEGRMKDGRFQPVKESIRRKCQIGRKNIRQARQRKHSLSQSCKQSQHIA
jgi:hypothetical protein